MTHIVPSNDLFEVGGKTPKFQKSRNLFEWQMQHRSTGNRWRFKPQQKKKPGLTGLFNK